jgi:predicted transcriptional regulator
MYTNSSSDLEPSMPDRATLTFHTSTETRARLETLATVTRRSKSFLANEAVTRYLAEEEAFVTAVQSGLAQADQGERISHDKAATYLHSLATDAPLPIPEPDAA